MFKSMWSGAKKKLGKKKTPKVVDTSPLDVPENDDIPEKHRQQEMTSPSKGDGFIKDPMWQLRLHVQGGEDSMLGGHSFISLIDPTTKEEVVMGMRPDPGDVNAARENSLMITGTRGGIYDDSTALLQYNNNDPKLASKTWDISERQALAVMAKFNRDRRKGQERLPDMSEMSAEDRQKLNDISLQSEVDRTQIAGGPDYALLTANCANWALECVEETQKPEVLKRMPGIEGQTDTRIDTKPFYTKGLAIPHKMRKHMPEQGVSVTQYRDRLTKLERRQKLQAKRDEEAQRKGIFARGLKNPKAFNEIDDPITKDQILQILGDRDENHPGGTMTLDEIRTLNSLDHEQMARYGAVTPSTLREFKEWQEAQAKQNSLDPEAPNNKIEVEQETPLLKRVNSAPSRLQQQDHDQEKLPETPRRSRDR